MSKEVTYFLKYHIFTVATESLKKQSWYKEVNSLSEAASSSGRIKANVEEMPQCCGDNKKIQPCERVKNFMDYAA